MSKGKTMKDQKDAPASVVEMDVRKFLRRINGSARSLLWECEEQVRNMGSKIGREMSLVALDAQGIILQEEKTGRYYQADLKKVKSQTVIENMKELQLRPSEEKEKFFQESLDGLIESIEEDNYENADRFLRKLTLARFQRNTVPQNGLVTTRDGVLRSVKVSNHRLSKEDKVSIVKSIIETTTGNVKVKRGRIVEAVFNDVPLMIPVNEFTRRRIVARKMKEVAMEAYKSPGFQDRIGHCLSLLSEDKGVEKVVNNFATFLTESQEFCLLNLAESQELVGKALATKGVFNEESANDLGIIFYKTGCNVNHDEILENWANVARMAEFPPLVENVRVLKNSKSFDEDYSEFLKMIFVEDVDTRSAKNKMYLVALKGMKKAIDDADEENSAKLNDLIHKMESAGAEVDDATLRDAEELVASVGENVIGDMETINDFDDIPQEEEGESTFGDEDLGSEEGESEKTLGASAPTEPSGSGLDDLLKGMGDEGDEGDEDEGEEGLGEGEEEEEEEEEPVPFESIQGSVEKQLREELKDLPVESIESELKIWKKNGKQFFEKDGYEKSTAHLQACIDECRSRNNEDLAEQFSAIMEANLPESNEDEDPYKYVPMDEDHTTMAKKMRRVKNGGQEGEKDSYSGEAMGSAEHPEDMNVKKDAGYKEAILKEGIVCPECHQEGLTLSECLKNDGVLCPHCGADVYDLMSEALSGAGHKMDRVSDGDGIVGSSVGKVAISGSGDKPAMDQDGKGIQKNKVMTGDSGGGKDEKMDHLGGKGITGRSAQDSDGKTATGGKKSAEGAKEEDQFKSGTRRRRMAFPNQGKATIAATEGKMKAMTIITDKDPDDVIKAIEQIAGGIESTDVDMEDELEGGTEGELEGGTEGEMNLPPEDLEGEETKEELTSNEEGFLNELESEEDKDAVPPMGKEGEEEEGEEEEGEEDEEEEEGKPFGEGKLPDHLKQFQFKGKKKEGDEKEKNKKPVPPKTDETDDEEGCVGECLPEDHDITQPKDDDYNSEDAARKDGDGKVMNKKPKIVDKDYDGSKGATVARPTGKK